MSVEELARRAGAATRAAVVSEVDVDAALAGFHDRRRRRARTRVAAVAVALAAAVLVALVVAPWSTPPSEPRPATHDGWCGVDPAVRCLSGSVVEVDATTPYSFEVPPTFGRVLMLERDGNLVEAYRQAPGVRAGVTVLQQVWPVGARDSRLDARRMAEWVAGRRFLAASQPERVLVGGRPGWRVDVVLQGRTATEAHRCNQWQTTCRPLLEQADGRGTWQTGPWRGMVSRYWFVDAPAGPVVVWSWAFHGDRRVLAANDELVTTLDLSAG